MSEYWKSTPKYWCKHCSAFVKDTPFEKRQHENTAKHQGNLKRFLRGIQNQHEKNEREKDRTKAELERVNRAVSGDQKPVTQPSTSSSSSRSVNASSRTLTAGDQKRQWAQLAEMGIAVPDNARGDMAMPGEWQLVKRQVEEPSLEADDKLNIGVRKRKFEGQEEEEEAGHTVVRKGWGSTVRNYPGAAKFSDSDPDLDALLENATFKKRSSVKRDPDASDSAKQEPVHDIQPSSDLNIKSEHEPDIPPQPAAVHAGDVSTRQATDAESDTQDLAPDGKFDPSILPQTDDPVVFKKRKTKPLRA